ncbi:elongation factor P maturation arginine rhamnosyltransferase EarP [soil metagenome]
MQWDIFCRVIDNYGDIGVCWRLSADLASRGHVVRLFVDDGTALAWMAPSGAAGVTVHCWEAASDPAVADPWIADVVIESFGCQLPEAYIGRMAAQAVAVRAPVWINLEYLSAEAAVERSHGLPSPQMSGPGAGLTKWFFYPGFTTRTGGLIREPALLDVRAAFDAASWLATYGIHPASGELVVSVFAYDVSALPATLARLPKGRKLLLATAGQAESVTAIGNALEDVRVHALPRLTQKGFDDLLWSCDLNLVRGEDSFVRAQWAARPFVWQIYPQHDAAHVIKLEAFLARYLEGADRELAESIRRLWLGWNALAADAEPASASRAAWNAWTDLSHAWRDHLCAQADLASQLIGFVAERS